MQTVELFCGTKSFSKIASKRGHKTFTVDILEEFKPTICKDIFEIQKSDLPKKIDVIWASPPCTTFSVASLRHYWKDKRPKNKKCWEGIAMVLKTIQLIEDVKKDNPGLLWFIENPRGMLRTQSFMQKFKRQTVTYCKYGDFRQKPTDIWTNCKEWKGQKVCSPGSKCHESAKRGQDKGSQSIGGGTKRGSILRAVIPGKLFEEIFDAIEKTPPANLDKFYTGGGPN